MSDFLLLNVLNDGCTPPRDITSLDRLFFDAAGRLTPVPAAALRDVDWLTLRIWCHYRGVYGIPTVELVEKLRELIGGRRAIEIGAGRGVFGRALGIPMTDSKAMERSDVRAVYAQMGQPVTPYGDDVEHLDAAAAVEKYAPEVVVGSWITQLISPVIHGFNVPGSIYGVDECALVRRVGTYLLFGARRTHDAKFLFADPEVEVEVLEDPNWFSRAGDDTRLYVFTHAAKNRVPSGALGEN